VEKQSVIEILSALNRAEVRYLVAGGLAVVAHGYLRFTADIDLVLDLHQDNLQRAVRVFQDLGYSPRAPVPFADFADATHRSAWVKEKGLTVFSLYSQTHPATEIDLFVESPFDFERAYSSAFRQSVGLGVVVTFVAFEDLLAMKRKANRAVDLEDIARLERIRQVSSDE
jgi:hypothetical protein